jgi:tetratricopeptide (TPR) repeat protein
VPGRPTAAPAQLFYSYSHKDEKLLERLVAHLSALKRDGLISGWHDRKIGAGTEWKGAIDEHLKAADIILLLVSADFLASDYCYDIELKYAMERHHKGEARVIPVILQPCEWETAPFAKLQALPKGGKAATKWPNRNDAFVNVAAGIRKALKEMGAGGPPATVVTPAANPLAAASAATLQQITSAMPVLNALHQLPAPPADFTGRQQELKELLEAVKTGGVTISGLQGLGGVGKTALALKLAGQLKADYADAQFYLDLKGVTQPLTPRDAMAYVVRAYHPATQLPEKEEELAPLYRSVLDGKRTLLLMDNARDAEQVAPLIPPAGCLLLVTSRKHFALPGLVEKNLDKLPPADARDLLLRIAPRLKKEKGEQVDELARVCGYLPLALRAVGSALEVKKNISPADYVNRLKETGKDLVLKEIDPSIQKSVGAALQSSYELLADDMQQKFRFLSVFPDTFEQSAAAAVWEVPLEGAQDSLGELFAYSLVEFDETTKRHGLHDLVRLFVGQILTAEERYAAQKRHAGHYVEVIRAADVLYRNGGKSVTRGLGLFDTEWTNIQAGQSWATEHAEDRDAAKLCARYPEAGAYCLLLRQHLRDRIRWLEPALAAARRLKQSRSEGTALSNLGLAYDNMGEYRRAIEYFEQAIQIAREIGDRWGEGAVLGNLGNAYDSLNDHSRAIEYHEQRLKIALEIGDRRGEGNALGNLGSAYGRIGEYRRAIEYFEQRLKIALEIGDRRGEGNALGNLGSAYARMGEYRHAIEYHEQSLVIKREIGDRSGEANSLWNSALALDQLGDRKAAITRAQSALKIYEAIESPVAARVRPRLAKWRAEDKSRSQGSAE